MQGGREKTAFAQACALDCLEQAVAPASDAGPGAALSERCPWPAPGELEAAFSALMSARGRKVAANSLAARDPQLISEVMPLLEAFYDHYFQCETEFLAEIPEGPVLVVGNHNGITGTPDMFCHMTAFWRRYGAQRKAYGLMHDVPFRVPWAGPWLNAAGALAANPDNGRRALRDGAALLVFPGGDHDACKPFTQRHRIDFGTRRGYVRLALREGVPIVPVVSAGAHESLFVAFRGSRIASALGLPKYFRSNVFPIGAALPWGLLFGVPLPHLPLPVKIHTRILPAIRPQLSAAAADDEALVEAVHRDVVNSMQLGLDDIVREGRFGLWPRGRGKNVARTLQSLLISAKRIGGV